MIAEEYTIRLGEKLDWRSNFVVEEHGKGVSPHILWQSSGMGTRKGGEPTVHA